MDRPQLSAGVGLRLPHLAEVAAGTAAAAWLEIHPENFLANPHARELLREARRQCPVSVHTVGISVGSADGIDHGHLARLRELVDEIEPMLVSGHLAWSTHGDAYLNDLLPLPYDDETLRIVASHVQQVQDALRRPFLIENPSSYVGFGASSMTEVEFLSALAARTGCRLLCDVSNIHVSGHNMGYDPRAYLDAFPAHAVDELHLGGFTPEPDEATPGSAILIDTHAAGIDAAVWPLYQHALRRFGAVPTLIEWDNDLPPFAVLVAEARRADAVTAAVFEEAGSAAAR
jgi:uncharacterized protein (UPF0276 family)